MLLARDAQELSLGADSEISGDTRAALESVCALRSVTLSKHDSPLATQVPPLHRRHSSATADALTAMGFSLEQAKSALAIAQRPNMEVSVIAPLRFAEGQLLLMMQPNWRMI